MKLAFTSPSTSNTTLVPADDPNTKIYQIHTPHRLLPLEHPETRISRMQNDTWNERGVVSRHVLKEPRGDRVMVGGKDVTPAQEGEGSTT